jgi:hypothetical protein
MHPKGNTQRHWSFVAAVAMTLVLFLVSEKDEFGAPSLGIGSSVLMLTIVGLNGHWLSRLSPGLRKHGPSAYFVIVVTIAAAFVSILQLWAGWVLFLILHGVLQL